MAQYCSSSESTQLVKDLLKPWEEEDSLILIKTNTALMPNLVLGFNTDCFFYFTMSSSAMLINSNTNLCILMSLIWNLICVTFTRPFVWMCSRCKISLSKLQYNLLFRNPPVIGPMYGLHICLTANVQRGGKVSDLSLNGFGSPSQSWFQI